MKTAFLIRGFNLDRTAADPEFKDLRAAIAERGYKVLPVPIHWRHKTVSQYSNEFTKYYEKNKTEENIVIGNSYGAMVTFLTAPLIKPDKAIICSLSAYFREDMAKQKQSYLMRRFGKKRTEDFHIISAYETARKLNNTNVETVFLRGERENWGRFIKLSERVKESADMVKGSKLIVVPNGSHSFRHPAYIKAIVALI